MATLENVFQMIVDRYIIGDLRSYHVSVVRCYRKHAAGFEDIDPGTAETMTVHPWAGVGRAIGVRCRPCAHTATDNYFFLEFFVGRSMWLQDSFAGRVRHFLHRRRAEAGEWRPPASIVSKCATGLYATQASILQDSTNSSRRSKSFCPPEPRSPGTRVWIDGQKPEQKQKKISPYCGGRDSNPRLRRDRGLNATP